METTDDVRSTSDHRYVEINEKMGAVNGMGAAMITVLMLVSTFGDWRVFGTIAVTQASVIAFNLLLVNKFLLARWGLRRAEVFRALVNTTSAVLLNHFSHWILPAWLFLPYVALVFDHLGRRTARAVLAFTVVGNTVGALVDGVPILLPIVFGSFAVFCSIISDVRFRVIRGMLVQADAQSAKLKQEIVARQKAEQELRQAQKLEAVGRLASGIAHEINTPIQFVGDSVSFLSEATKDLVDLIDCYRANVRTPSEHAALAKAEALADLPYLKEEVPKAVDRTLEGLGRVAGIVRSMRDFAHPDKKEMKPTDINHGIRLTLTISRHEYKDVADIVTDLGPLPPVVCHSGEINQVLLNLLVNAAHAIADVGSAERGRITIRTRQDGAYACIEIEDTGTGIPDAIRERVFDPFFTTKPVGKGTGQGLSLARRIVIGHGGKLSCESTLGRGTKFVIRLPIDGTASAAA